MLVFWIKQRLPPSKRPCVQRRRPAYLARRPAPGGGGAVGYRHVAGQKPDGHSLVWNSNSIYTTHHMGLLQLSYDAFEPVAQVLVESPVVAVRGDAQMANARRADRGQQGRGPRASRSEIRASAVTLTSPRWRCSGPPAPMWWTVAPDHPGQSRRQPLRLIGDRGLQRRRRHRRDREPDRRDETIAAARDIGHISDTGLPFPQRLAKPGDVHTQGGLVDGDVRPHAGHQLLLADDFSGVSTRTTRISSARLPN
jgi:hypothetical protein